MTDIIPASDPRVRVTLTFHPEGQAPLSVSLPRWDFLDEASVRDIKAALRRFKQDAEKQSDEIRRQFRKYQVESRKYQKALAAWEKRLDDPDVEDPGPEPEEPERPDFGEQMDEREAERTANLALFKVVLTDEQFSVVENCTSAEIAQAKAEWDRVSAVPLGGIIGLSDLLDGEHGGAIRADLLARGWTIRDIGPRISWGDVRDLIAWLPPNGDSAYYRSLHPRSWWWTPLFDFLAMILVTLQGANWQRGGGKGTRPKIQKRPSDKPPAVRSVAELDEKKRAQADHIRRRRAQKQREVASG
ncbi:tail assembly chaperone [Mycobacterium phage Avani]|uniref:Tail assembly chaperone n=3 Tax=Avanivirus TaxID=2843352 RepID=A0A2D1G9P6_9CAUD|nr:tail assembly chaperone [Mycobacterium phage Avani]YP_009613919.1 tail assembly chaperone [Mycobacterium phage Yoshi]YP_009963713.1 tail assembly chaperone [Mycobacterium phage Demsculpinboyz]AEK07767.1 tail assembly chaperone [Mycobacterium phage Yoshi]AFL47930.1 tail assembly chaperone [Mycobacterium phage Avani]ATN88611.1 tail assembly chaperone [Mycobacterium phage Demsculpinboyz]